jgi:hypothetical protein
MRRKWQVALARGMPRAAGRAVCEHSVSRALQATGRLLEHRCHCGGTSLTIVLCGTQVLIAASTNVAVDNVLLGLQRSGFTDFARVGSVKKIAKPVRCDVVPVPHSSPPPLSSPCCLHAERCPRLQTRPLSLLSSLPLCLSASFTSSTHNVRHLASRHARLRHASSVTLDRGRYFTPLRSPIGVCV